MSESTPVYTYQHTMRSRYSETDKMGYVYYARYLEYFEVARTEMIRSLGMPYRQMEERGVMLPVIESHVHYKAPLFYDDEISIHVRVADIPVIKMKTSYEMYSHDGQQLHASASVNLCFVNAESRKPCRAPRFFVDKLSAVALES